MTAEKMMAQLQLYADDPMWADHAEVPKRLLHEAIAVIRSSAVGAGAREALLVEALGEIANRAGNFMDADAADWMPSIYKIACEAIGSDPWPMLEANGWKRDDITASLQSEPVQPAGKGEDDVDQDALLAALSALNNPSNVDLRNRAFLAIGNALRALPSDPVRRTTQQGGDK